MSIGAARVAAQHVSANAVAERAEGMTNDAQTSI